MAYQGKTVSEIAALNNETPAQGFLRIIRESATPGQTATIVAKSMSETGISNFIKWSYSNICTDGTMKVIRTVTVLSRVCWAMYVSRN